MGDAFMGKRGVRYTIEREVGGWRAREAARHVRCMRPAPIGARGRGRMGKRMVRTTAAGAVFGAALALSALAGCVATEAPPPPRSVVVNGPPPAPLPEQPPPPPSPHAVWVGGYWHWVGTQYAWIPGHWEQAPRGARWQAPRYSVVEGSYTYEPGAWQGAQRGGAPERSGGVAGGEEPRPGGPAPRPRQGFVDPPR